jgi:serine/threonine protein kinase
VLECKHRRSGAKYAVKMMEKLQIRDAESIEDIDREVQLLKLVAGHPNLISLSGAYEDHEYVYLVMELCEGGDLYQRIDSAKGKQLPEEQV